MELQEVDFANPLTFNPWLDGPPAPVMELKVDEEKLKENLWGFSYYSWPKIKKKFGTVEKLYAAIEDIHRNIQDLREKYRDQATGFPDLRVEYNLDGGVSGSYFLVDENGKRKFVVKPLDEDAGAIHSRNYPSPFSMSPFCSNMPLYCLSMREVLAYRVAQMIGVKDVVPKTEFGILKSEVFHDFLEGIRADERKRYTEACGVPDKEKLCSVQEYVEDAKSLFEALQDLQGLSLSDDEIAARFEQKNFEEANILLWTTFDTDGHSSNFLVYSKGVDAIGNEILALKKIDNGLAFPDKNQQLKNSLSFMPNATRELSDEAKAKILAIDVDQLAAQFEKVGLESATAALKERISFLQELVKREKITIRELNNELYQGLKRNHETDIILSSKRIDRRFR